MPCCLNRMNEQSNNSPSHKTLHVKVENKLNDPNSPKSPDATPSAPKQDSKMPSSFPSHTQSISNTTSSDPFTAAVMVLANAATQSASLHVDSPSMSRKRQATSQLIRPVPTKPQGRVESPSALGKKRQAPSSLESPSRHRVKTPEQPAPSLPGHAATYFTPPARSSPKSTSQPAPVRSSLSPYSTMHSAPSPHHGRSVQSPHPAQQYFPQGFPMVPPPFMYSPVTGQQGPQSAQGQPGPGAMPHVYAELMQAMQQQHHHQQQQQQPQPPQAQAQMLPGQFPYQMPMYPIHMMYPYMPGPYPGPPMHAAVTPPQPTQTPSPANKRKTPVQTPSSSDTSPESKKKVRREKKPVTQRPPIPTDDIKYSVIECGYTNDDGKRVKREFTSFFKRSVPVFIASNDPTKEKLYRASDISRACNTSAAVLAMFLKRRKRQKAPGIYQASSFKYKEYHDSNIKRRGYFVSMKICRAFARGHPVVPLDEQRNNEADTVDGPDVVSIQGSSPSSTPVESKTMSPPPEHASPGSAEPRPSSAQG